MSFKRISYMNFNFFLFLLLFLITSSINAQEQKKETLTESEIDYRDLMDLDNGVSLSLNELIGFWKLIELPNKINRINSMKKGEYIYYCFTSNGEFYKFINKSTENLTVNFLENYIDEISEKHITKYTLIDNDLITESHLFDMDLKNKWKVNIVTIDYGIAFKGDLFLSPQPTEFSEMNFILLRRIE